MLLRIRDWNQHFENSSSRKLKRLEWVAIPNKTDGEGYTALVDHPNGAAHLGAWYAIIEAASKQTIRGQLPCGIPHDFGGICRSLGRMSRLPASIFEEVLPRLIEIGWIEEVQQNQQIATTVADNADMSADSASGVAGGGIKMAAHYREGNYRELQAAAEKPSPEFEAPDEEEPPTAAALKNQIRDIANLKSLTPPRRNGSQDGAAVETVRDWLKKYPGSERLPGEPDDDIGRQCIALAQGDVSRVVGALRDMSAAGKRPAISWAYFPKVLPQYLGGKPA